MAVQLKAETEALLEQEARRRGQDVDSLVRDFLKQAQAEGQARREEALQDSLTFFNSGISFGGGPHPRAEIYEERMQELDARRERARRPALETNNGYS